MKVSFDGLPQGVEIILQLLEKEGHSAYIVGGAVRDILLKRPVADYDVTTSALPEEIVAITEKHGLKTFDNLGRNFGVVTVICEGTAMEVATFRGESYGLDSHRPEKVWFASCLEEDLARRDFTINAMAVDRDGNIYDPFGGVHDLVVRIIRAVGNPEERFREDALRMFRACRFAAQLDFNVDQKTLAAIPGALFRVEGLSMERVRAEIEKILISANSAAGIDLLVSTGLAGQSCRMKAEGIDYSLPILPELVPLAELSKKSEFNKFNVWRHTLGVINSVQADLALRWAALLHDIAVGMPGIREETGLDDGILNYSHDTARVEIAGKIMERFQNSRKITKRVKWLVSRHMRCHVLLTGTDRTICRWLREEARSGQFRDSRELAEAVSQLLELCKANALAAKNDSCITEEKFASRARRVNDLLLNIPVHTRDLNYDSKALLAIIKTPQALGDFLKNALRRVQDGGLENEKRALENAAEKWLRRHPV